MYVEQTSLIYTLIFACVSKATHQEKCLKTNTTRWFTSSIMFPAGGAMKRFLIRFNIDLFACKSLEMQNIWIKDVYYADLYSVI